MKIVVIGAGSDLGVHIDGASLGAEKLINELESINEKIILKQDENIIKEKETFNRRKNENSINAFNANLYKVILDKTNDDYFPILVGGDHSISVASSLASAKKHNNIGIIWFDAHTDYNTLDTTTTGNIHGLPLATINGYNESLKEFHNGNKISAKNTVVVGARSIDKEEINNIKKAGITVFTTHDIKIMGIENVVKKAFSIALNNTSGVHISFDLDLIDPFIAPGVSVPEKDGINKEETLKINEEITKYIDKIVSYDLVEYNPLLDKDNKTLDIAINILQQVIDASKNK